MSEKQLEMDMLTLSSLQFSALLLLKLEVICLKSF